MVESHKCRKLVNGHFDFKFQLSFCPTSSHPLNTLYSAHLDFLASKTRWQNPRPVALVPAETAVSAAATTSAPAHAASRAPTAVRTLMSASPLHLATPTLACALTATAATSVSVNRVTSSYWMGDTASRRLEPDRHPTSFFAVVGSKASP